MKRLHWIWMSCSILFLPYCAQKGGPNPIPMENPAFEVTLQQLLSFSVPVTDAKDLQNIQDEVFIFDTRNEKEYAVSHIPKAIWLGYEDPKWEILDSLSRDAPIVLYCSVGYRSEIIGDKLIEQGFSQVKNLYGGIFAWVNNGLPVVDNQGDTVNSVHAYSGAWSSFVDAPDMEKVW